MTVQSRPAQTLIQRTTPSPTGDYLLSAPLRIALFYLLFGIIWHLVTDVALVGKENASPSSYWSSASKGILFTVLSAVMLYVLLRHHVQSVSRANALARAVIDGINDAVFVKDRQGRYLMFNAAAARFVGKSIADVIGRDDTEVFESFSAAVVMERDKRVMATGETDVAEEELTANGFTRTYLASKVPFRDAHGAVIGIIGISRDISQRKEAELNLRLERDRFEKIVETVPVIICSFQKRLDGSVFFPYASSRIESILGATPQALAEDGSRWYAHVHPEDLPYVHQSIDESAQHMRNWHATFRVRRPIRGEIWLEGCSTPTQQLDGSILWHGYFADVTERHVAEATFHEIQQRLLQAQSIANMGSWSWDPTSNVVWWSEAIYELFGYNPQTQPPSVEAFLALLSDTDRELAIARVEAIRSGGDGFAIELRIHRPDGRVVWISSVARATRNAQHGLVRVDGFDQDISDLRRLEDQLHQSRKMEAVGHLAGGVAHDFNNMLTVIQGYCEVLSFKTPDMHANRASIVAIQQAADRATQLTRQLLAFSRKAMIEPLTLDLNDSVIQLEMLLRRMFAANIELEIIHGQTPCYIEADPIQIDQVILNLALNACDAMPTGGRLTIKTQKLHMSLPSLPPQSLADAQSPCAGRFIELTVTDTGCGMTDEVKSKIFEPFFTTKAQVKTSGLGLSVVHGIMQQSRGKIEVATAVGKGTTFRLLFREASALPTPASKKSSRASQGAESVMVAKNQDA